MTKTWKPKPNPDEVGYGRNKKGRPHVNLENILALPDDPGYMQAFNGLSKMRKEDIVKKFADIILEETQEKKAYHSENPTEWTRLGYIKFGSTSLAGFRPDPDDPDVMFHIKGGNHELLKYRLQRNEKRKLALEIAKICGFKSYKMANGSIHINIPKTDRRKNPSRLASRL